MGAGIVPVPLLHTLPDHPMQSRYRISLIQRGIFNGSPVATFCAHYLQEDGTWFDCGRFLASIRAPRSTLWRTVAVEMGHPIEHSAPIAPVTYVDSVSLPR